MNLIVRKRRRESDAQLIDRFKRLVFNTDFLQEIKKKSFFQDATSKRLLKLKRQKAKR